MAGGFATEDPRAPDGGWGWVVVFASFIQQALSIGITYTFGILMVDLLAYFHEDESTTAWIGSIQPALLYFTGIMAGPVIKKYGWRKVAVLGSCLSSLGYATSACAMNVYILYLTYGVLTGIGNGLMYVTSMVAVQHYFSSKRAMATGIAVAGSGVGTLFFGLVTPVLLERLGWRYTLLVQSGILLSGIFAGLLFRPLPELAVNERTPILSTDHNNVRVDVHGKDDKKSANEVNGVNGVNEFNNSIENVEANKKKCCGCLKNSFFSQIIDMEIARDPVFQIFGASLILFCIGYHVPYTFTPERAQKVIHESQEKSSLLVSFMGIANVASRLLFGWLADRNEVFRFYLASFVLTSGGLVSALMPVYTNYSSMIIYSVFFGTFTGCFVALFPVLLVDLLGINRIESSLGMCMGISSISFLFAAPISGWIITMTRNFDIPFMLAGCCEIAGGLIFLTIPCIIHRRCNKDPNYESFEKSRRADISESYNRHHYLTTSFS